jgi:hypothetical protein
MSTSSNYTLESAHDNGSSSLSAWQRHKRDHVRRSVAPAVTHVPTTATVRQDISNKGNVTHVQGSVVSTKDMSNKPVQDMSNKPVRI